MSDEGEKMCPLCAEEMDLTDQQLKPCKCGYEICVWCWHHIMDMAEKDETEGRCPACRVPYDKEKIERMAANCERLVAEINMERKIKSQKAKTKSSDGRKQLSSVRVIQRNLVYIVGLPLNLADEDLLQRKEYFGQYGKVLKVSMSRTAAGVIQQFPNNTCSVYITYSKEEEAVRCIQSVHGFVLEGRSLRACFGTTKYCHAWLRNVPCSNPDCLYLHEIGSQEDSFTKDEIISAYTRSRVQQITGATMNLQRRSGSVLPPPADEFFINSSASTGKPVVKSASNNSASLARGSPPNSSSGRSAALPAAASWGMRASNCQPQAAGSAYSNGPDIQKPDTFSGPLAFSSAVASTTQASTLHSDVSTLHSDVGKKLVLNEESHTMQGRVKLDPLKSMKQHIGMDSRTTAFEKPVTEDGTPPPSCPPESKDNDWGTILPPKIMNSFDLIGQSCGSDPEKDGTLTTDGKIRNSCSDLPLISIDRSIRNEQNGVVRPNCSLSERISIKSPGSQGLQPCYAEQFRETLTSAAAVKAATSINGVYVSREQSDWKSDLQTHVGPNVCSEVEEDLLYFNDQRLKDSEVVRRSTYLPYSADSVRISNHSREHSFHHSEAYAPVKSNADPPFVNKNAHEGSFPQASSISGISNGYPDNLFSSSASLDRSTEHFLLLPNEGKGKQMERFQGDAANIDSNAATDTGESSIISNILSLDLDAWDDSLTSPQNLAKLFGETDKQRGALKISSSWKVQNSNQSRFDFARQDESKSQVFDFEPSFSNIGQVPKDHFLGQDFLEKRDPYVDKIGNGNSFSSSNFEEFVNFASSQSVPSSNKFSVSRAQISAPPGFSVPSRAPPPGFSSHERMDQVFETTSGSHLLDGSSLLRNSYQVPQTGNMNNTGDIELIDPAILAVGKGRLPGGLNNPGLDMRSNYPPQFSAFENEARLQLMMQRSISPQQNLRFTDVGDYFSPLNDAYGIHSRLMEQSQANNISQFAQLSLQQSRNALMSNGHWDGWSEAQSGNNMGMAELLRNERLGFNKFYTSYEDSKFRMPSSGDLYNRTFGM